MSYTTKVTLSNILSAAGAGRRATAVVIVDENDRGLLITRRTIRAPIVVHVETGNVQTIVRGDWVVRGGLRRRERERGMERSCGFLEGLYSTSRSDFPREAVFEGIDGDQ